MKIIALLSWYDERPSWLAGVVASLAHLQCEHVIALDGAYALYPNGRHHSPPEQSATIEQVCHSLGMGCTISSPQEPWFGNEVEKRNMHFRLAEAFAEPFKDWYFTIDADTFVTEAGVFRTHLEDADEDTNVADVRFIERADGIESGGMLRCVHRAIPGLRYVGNHFSPVTPAGVNLHPPSTPCVSLPMVTVEHRTRERDRWRKESQQGYYDRRDRMGAEWEADVAAA